MERWCESNIIFPCVCPSVRRPSICRSRYLLNHRLEVIQTCYITSPHGKVVREQHYFSLRPSVRPSILINHWAEFNQTCYINSYHGKSVRKQHYFTGRPAISRPSICPLCYNFPFLLKPLGRIQPNLLHNFSSLVCESNTIFSVRLSRRPASVHLSVMLSPPKLQGGS